MRQRKVLLFSRRRSRHVIVISFHVSCSLALSHFRFPSAFNLSRSVVRSVGVVADETRAIYEAEDLAPRHEGVRYFSSDPGGTGTGGGRRRTGGEHGVRWRCSFGLLPVEEVRRPLVGSEDDGV